MVTSSAAIATDQARCESGSTRCSSVYIAVSVRFFLPSKEVVGHYNLCCECSYYKWDDVREEGDVMDSKCVGRGGVIRGQVAAGLAGVKGWS